MPQFLRIILSNKDIRRAYLAWFSVALFYLYQYILRVAPGIMVDQMMGEFRIKAEEFATLGFLDALAYAAMQIPLGIIVDKVGVKKTVMTSIALCVTGSLLFGCSTHFLMIQFSRLLTGVGSASAFMCALKIIADCFPSEHRGILMGLTLTLGMCGALMAGKLVVLLVESANWRDVFYGASLLGLIIGGLIYYSVTNEGSVSSMRLTRKSKKSWSNWGKILKNRDIMIYAVLATGLYVPLSVLADLWGTVFMKQKYSLSQADGAYLSSLLYLGLGIGSIIIPWIAEKFRILNAIIFFCGVGILLLFSVLLYGPELSYEALSITLIVLGVLCGAEMLCFTGALLACDEGNSGEIIGLVNTFNMLGGAFLKYGVGVFLDANWNGVVQENGLRYYDTTQYTHALSSLTLVLTVCCLISLLLFRKKLKIA